MTDYYSIQLSQDVIEHFGIKGMKWGPRRVVSSRGAARAQRKLTRLNKRMTDTIGNRFKDEFAGSFQGLDGQYRRYQNGRKIEKQQAKILSNKKVSLIKMHTSKFVNLMTELTMLLETNGKNPRLNMVKMTLELFVIK